MGPQNCIGVLTLGNLGLPLGGPENKCHLGVGPVAKHKVYYKGESGGLLQIWVVVSLVSPSLRMVRRSNQKCSSYALTNLLFGLGKFV
jgi:hypothetical protein